MKIFRRIRALFRREKLDAEMSDEMRAHLDLQTRENIARGMSPEDARYAAERSFGGVEQIKERARDQRSFRWVDDLGRDLRFGLRVLVKAPIVSAVIVLSLALGLGANTAVFSWIRTVALEPLPGVRDGAKLVLIEQRTASGIVQFASAAEWRDVREQSGAFTDVVAHNIGTFNLEGVSQDVRV